MKRFVHMGIELVRLMKYEFLIINEQLHVSMAGR